MSIRINIVMGYGLTNVITTPQPNGTRIITDSRLNTTNGELCLDYRKYDINDFQQLVKHGDYELFTKTVVSRLSKPPVNHVIYDSESGLPNVLLLIPIGDCNGWFRRDSDIDYEMARGNIYPNNKAQPMNPWVKKLHNPIYPYSDWYDTQENVQVTDNEQSRRIPEIIQKTLEDSHYRLNNEDKELFPHLTNGSDVKFRYIPEVPETVIALSQYLKLFTNDIVAKQLSPIIYSYWN